MIARHALAILLLLGAALVPPEATAQTTDRLPSGGRVNDPIKRGPDGRLERVDPARATCSKGALCVGRGHAYPTLAAALAASRDGDTIELLAGTYRETAAIERNRIVLRGIGGRVHFDCVGLAPVQDKGCLLLAGWDATVEGIEISGGSAACLANAPNRSFTLRRVFCHDSRDGIVADGGVIAIEGSEFAENGRALTAHNADLGGNCPSATVRNTIFREAKLGDELRSRCRRTVIADSIFRLTTGGRAIDLPAGGDAIVSDVVITQLRGVRNPDLIAFAEQGCGEAAPLRVLRARIAADHPEVSITNHDLCPGQPIVLEGTVFEGRRPVLRGYVLER